MNVLLVMVRVSEANPGVGAGGGEEGLTLPHSIKAQRSWKRSVVRGKIEDTGGEAMFDSIPKKDSPVNGRRTKPNRSHGTVP